MEERTIIAIEIGSSRLKGAIGICNPEAGLKVLAVEEEPMVNWVRYGAVSNVEEVATLVSRVIRKIENRMSPRKVNTVYVGLGGRSFCSSCRNVEQTWADDMEITDSIISSMISRAGEMPYSDREVLAVIPREYVVDKTVVAQPRGTVGRRLRLSANVISSRPQCKRNIERIFGEKLRVEIGGYQVRQLAMGEVVLTDDEKRLGCMLVDFGAETTTVSVYKEGRLQYMATMPLGSRNITRDLKQLNIIEERAEQLKCAIGNASGQQHSGMLGSLDAEVDYTKANNYVSYRVGEIIANIRQQIRYAGLNPSDLAAGIVVVGRGALLSGFNERLGSTIGLKVRMGGIVRGDITLADPRISAYGAIDVISVMYMAAKEGAAECLSYVVEPEPEPEPEPQQPIRAIDEPEPEEEPEPEPVRKERKPKKPKGPSKFDRFKNWMSEFISEAEDDELRDD